PKTVHDKNVEPVVVTAGLHDHFFLGGNAKGGGPQKINLLFSNAAAKLHPNPGQWSPDNAPAPPPILTITAEGNQNNFLIGLSNSITYVLSPQQQQHLSISLKQLLTPSVLAKTSADQLYGTRLHIEAHKDGDTKNLLDKNIYIYRLLDAGDD